MKRKKSKWGINHCSLEKGQIKDGTKDSQNINQSLQFVIFLRISYHSALCVEIPHHSLNFVTF